jgi:hypothetical protein
MTGARIDEVVVRHHPRIHGESKYGISRTFKVLSDMVTIKMITQFAGRPGVWFGLLAIPWLVLGAASAMAWLAELWFSPGTPSIVFSSLTVMFFYLFGHLVSLAVLSEVLLGHTGRGYLTRLADVLTVSLSSSEGGRLRGLS